MFKNYKKNTQLESSVVRIMCEMGKKLDETINRCNKTTYVYGSHVVYRICI